MKFCKVCDNMLYIKSEDSRLTYYCRHCNFSNDEAPGSHCIFENSYVDDDLRFKQYATDNIKYDKTLPRVNNIKCPNGDCKRNGKEEEVIYLKYDQENMKYLYYCCHCSTFWKQN